MEDYSRGGSGDQDLADQPEVWQETSGGVDRKYGGLQPKKRPLIKKGHARAFFDSADWELHKQGVGIINQEEMTAQETLRPKLQRTPHQQLPPRRPTCSSGRLHIEE
ncbi:hypothetical protein SAY86_028883 [Trapa natans]|uniref:cAMP-regulated phosphoprotein 19-related protein n=1 Tax=Trapa natans TaxID=22666 RepID=A0AAN7M265_TRANT|nr:hypothetical protein SAY86_028883 [Trapa natans]